MRNKTLSFYHYIPVFRNFRKKNPKHDKIFVTQAHGARTTGLQLHRTVLRMGNFPKEMHYIPKRESFEIKTFVETK